MDVHPDTLSTEVYQGQTAAFIVRGGNNSTFVHFRASMNYLGKGGESEYVILGDYVTFNGSYRLEVPMGGPLSQPGWHSLNVFEINRVGTPVGNNVSEARVWVYPDPVYQAHETERVNNANAANNAAFLEGAWLLVWVVVGIIIALEVKRWWDNERPRSLGEIFKGGLEGLGAFWQEHYDTVQRTIRRHPIAAAAVEARANYRRALHKERREKRLRRTLERTLNEKRAFVDAARAAATTVETVRPGDKRVRPIHRLRDSPAMPPGEDVDWPGDIDAISKEAALRRAQGVKGGSL